MIHKITEIGGIKNGGKKDNKGDNLQDKLLKNILENEKRMIIMMQNFCHWQMN